MVLYKLISGNQSLKNPGLGRMKLSIQNENIGQETVVKACPIFAADKASDFKVRIYTSG